jgi:catechol 2,3-dioxygenase-like lactoylglutathione lyase family enzyme
MNIKSGAGIVCYVDDIAKTIEFYERLGFQFKLKEATRATAYLNWWWIDFHQLDTPDAPPWHTSRTAGNEEAGALFYFSVDNVQRAYEELIGKGFNPPSEPVDLRGNREFLITDPDGYRLVFFKRK